MKEIYYQSNSIAKQAQAFLQKLLPLRRSHHYQLNPAKAALLVIDLQRFFLDNSSHAYIPSAPAILPLVMKLQKISYERGIKVIQTRHLNQPLDTTMMAKWWGRNHLLTSSDPLSLITPELAVVEGTIITKSQYDAFYDSKLDEILSAAGIEQLIITGVMTHLCCETTARAAFVKGYEVFFAIDGTATYNAEFHLGSLINLAHGFAIPLLVDEIIDNLNIN